MSCSPRRINVLVWIMAVGSLNCSETMQRKLSNTCLLPSVCPFCLENSELLIHLFIFCPFSSNCWFSIFSMLKSVWVFDGSFSTNVLQLLRGPYLSKKKPFLIWVNLIKALLAEIWFERNQCNASPMIKKRDWVDIVEISKRNAAAWCSSNAEFKDYSIQDICLNWTAFIG